MDHPSSTGRRGARPQRGFTLIELMITVAVIAIIAAVALPSYSSYVKRAKRADARTQLLQVAQFMQRFYSANDQYEKDRSNAEVFTKIPDNLKKSPADGTPQYNLSVTATVSSYTIKMTPTGGMTGDECGTYTLNSAGQRGNEGATKSVEYCWK
jgi:type IV pilus assembly protein PilE